MLEFSVTKNGKELPKSKYIWNEKTKVFSTEENNLVIDFSHINRVTFNTSYSCTFNAGSDCTFNTGSDCTFNTGWGCTFNTGWGCTFKTDYSCTFKTDYSCTFKTSSDCTFNTGWGCTFKTGYNCTFKTGYNCTFSTGSACTFNTGGTSAIVRKDTNEVIRLKADITYKLCPFDIKGYLTKLPDENAFYKEVNGERVEHIIADNILSKVIKKKGNVYHVKNHKSKKATYLVKDGDIYSHGDTLEEAKESLQYKVSSRDTSEFERYSLDDELDKVTLIRAYRAITGACEGGTKYFCENTEIPARLTVREAIELTKGQYNSSLFEEFFTKKCEV